MEFTVDRRSFLRRAAAVLPLMHAGGLFALPPAPSRDTMENQPPKPIVPPARFARLRLRTQRMNEMLPFYRDTLGLPVTHENDRFVVTAGATAIDFTSFTPPPPVADSPDSPASQPYYHFAFNIPHNTLEAAMKWLEPRCPLVKLGNGGFVAHFPAWNAHAVYFLDPAGNILEFIARHTLQNDVANPTEFSERDILCASEIGVVAPDVVQAADQLCAAVGVDRYHGGNEQFTAVGDEHGLFIVVKTGRRWFSSDRAAEVFPTEAVVRDRGLTRRIELAESAFVAAGTSAAADGRR